jgi:hypothetical protein
VTYTYQGDADVLLAAALEGKRNERELRAAIVEAAVLLKASGGVGRDSPEFIDAVAAWFERPAVNSAIALEAADKGGQ